MEGERQKPFFIIGGAIIVITAFGLGAFFGYTERPAIDQITTVFDKEIEKPDSVDFSPFWKAWKIVEDKYAAPNGINREDMVWGAIQGALKSLDDPYTVFFPPVEKELFESEIQGNFEGVGMEIGIRDGLLTVISPLKGTPAYNAGIKAGDKILKIDEKDTLDLKIEEAVRLIRGPSGTTVKLIVLSAGKDEPREVNITRDTIRIPVLETKQLEDGIFMIELHNFSAGSPFEFRLALRDFALSGSDKLILDLRNNPGGFLEAAVDISSWFLDTGKVVVREKFKNGDERVHRSRGFDAFKNLKMAVLVNRGSASASEIVAGALKDHSAAKIVGERTFGKGSVQEFIGVTDTTALKVTIARWLTPDGNDISENGLAPDIEVKITEEDEIAGRDPQLEKAIELLKK